MSREQWGHGYWKGVEDAQNGNIRWTLLDQAKFWIAHMCYSNSQKYCDRTLFPVSSLVSQLHFCGLSTKYAKKIYNYILNHNDYEFEPGKHATCYVTGGRFTDWLDDHFVIPIYDHPREYWANIIDGLIQKNEEKERKSNGF